MEALDAQLVNRVRLAVVLFGISNKKYFLYGNHTCTSSGCFALQGSAIGYRGFDPSWISKAYNRFDEDYLGLSGGEVQNSSGIVDGLGVAKRLLASGERKGVVANVVLLYTDGRFLLSDPEILEKESIAMRMSCVTLLAMLPEGRWSMRDLVESRMDSVLKKNDWQGSRGITQLTDLEQELVSLMPEGPDCAEWIPHRASYSADPQLRSHMMRVVLVVDVTDVTTHYPSYTRLLDDVVRTLEAAEDTEYTIILFGINRDAMWLTSKYPGVDRFSHEGDFKTAIVYQGYRIGCSREGNESRNYNLTTDYEFVVGGERAGWSFVLEGLTLAKDVLFFKRHRDLNPSGYRHRIPEASPETGTVPREVVVLVTDGSFLSKNDTWDVLSSHARMLRRGGLSLVGIAPDETFDDSRNNSMIRQRFNDMVAMNYEHYGTSNPIGLTKTAQLSDTLDRLRHWPESTGHLVRAVVLIDVTWQAANHQACFSLVDKILLQLNAVPRLEYSVVLFGLRSDAAENFRLRCKMSAACPNLIGTAIEFKDFEFYKPYLGKHGHAGFPDFHKVYGRGSRADVVEALTVAKDSLAQRRSKTRDFFFISLEADRRGSFGHDTTVGAKYGFMQQAAPKEVVILFAQAHQSLDSVAQQALKLEATAMGFQGVKLIGTAPDEEFNQLGQHTQTNGYFEDILARNGPPGPAKLIKIGMLTETLNSYVQAENERVFQTRSVPLRLVLLIDVSSATEGIPSYVRSVESLMQTLNQPERIEYAIVLFGTMQRTMWLTRYCQYDHPFSCWNTSSTLYRGFDSNKTDSSGFRDDYVFAKGGSQDDMLSGLETAKRLLEERRYWDTHGPGAEPKETPMQVAVLFTPGYLLLIPKIPDYTPQAIEALKESEIGLIGVLPDEVYEDRQRNATIINKLGNIIASGSQSLGPTNVVRIEDLGGVLENLMLSANVTVRVKRAKPEPTPTDNCGCSCSDDYTETTSFVM